MSAQAPEIPVLEGQTTIDEVLPPKRVQRRRVKGWRMPPNTVYVGRGSHWGNHCVIEAKGKCGPFDVVIKNQSGQTIGFVGQQAVIKSARFLAADTYWRWLVSQSDMWLDGYLRPLRGKNLACWCPEDQYCHGDLLLEAANGDGSWRA